MGTKKEVRHSYYLGDDEVQGKGTDVFDDGLGNAFPRQKEERTELVGVHQKRDKDSCQDARGCGSYPCEEGNEGKGKNEGQRIK